MSNEIDHISSFTGDYSFLSNFHPAEVSLDDINYPSVEHAYQAAKTLNKEERKPFHDHFGTGTTSLVLVAEVPPPKVISFCMSISDKTYY